MSFEASNLEQNQEKELQEFRKEIIREFKDDPHFKGSEIYGGKILNSEQLDEKDMQIYNWFKFLMEIDTKTVSKEEQKEYLRILNRYRDEARKTARESGNISKKMFTDFIGTKLTSFFTRVDMDMELRK